MAGTDTDQHFPSYPHTRLYHPLTVDMYVILMVYHHVMRIYHLPAASSDVIL